MPQIQTVTSRENRWVKQIIALQSGSKARKESGLFVLEGLRICSDAAENGIRFRCLAVTEAFAKKFQDAFEAFCDLSETVVQVPETLFEKIADTDSPQGVLAVGVLPENNPSLDPNGRYLGLENLADPSNLGAVARTAEALGVGGIVLSKGSCDAFSPKALRASMGTLLRLPLFFCEDLCGFAKTHGLRTLACVVERDAEPISSLSFAAGDLLLIGNEANGLSAQTKAAADCLVTIPMTGRAESLNAAAAAAIAMWEMMQ